MAIVGVASIRVKPDLTEFRKELKAGLEKIDPKFQVNVTANVTKARVEIDRFIRKEDGRKVNVKIDVDQSSADRVRNVLAGIARVLGTGGLAAGAFSLALTAKLIKLALVAGAVASALGGLTTVVGGLGAALAAMGAAAVGVGIAGLAGLAAVAVTVKLATKGMGDAFKALADGDAKKLNEALKGMAPAAQDFVRGVAKLKPEFDKLQLAVQSNLFRGLGTEVQKTGSVLLKTFSGTFLQIADSINFVARDLFSFLRQADTVKTLGVIGDNLAAGFRNASSAIKPFVAAFLDILKAGSALLPGLGTSLADITKKFAAFIHAKTESGALTAFFQKAIDTVKQFGRVIRDFGVGIFNIFHIASDATGGFLDRLESASKKFRTFTESAKGQEIFKGVAEVVKTLASAFGDFLRALAPLLPIVGQFVKLLADNLAKILQKLGPVIEKVGKVLIDTLSEVLPELVPFVIRLAEAFGDMLVAVIPLAKPILGVLKALEPLIEPLTRLVQKLIPPLTTLIEALTPVIEVLAKTLGFLITVLSKVAEGVGHVFDGLESLGKGGLLNVGNNILGLMNGSLLAAASSQKGNLLKTLKDAVDFAIIGSTTGPTAFDAALRVTRGYISGFQAGKVSLTTQVQIIVDSVMDILGAGPRKRAQEDGKAITRALADGMTAEQQKVLNFVNGLMNQIHNIFNGSNARYEQAGRGIANSLNGGVAAGGSTINGTVAGLAQSMVSIFGGVSLHAQGVAIMNSLINGLNAKKSFLITILESITALIPLNKGPISKDRKLLTPAGLAIMDGLIGAIESKQTELQSTLKNVTDQFTNTFDPKAGGWDSNFSASLGASISATGDFTPTPVIVNVNTDHKALKDFVQVEIGEGNRVTRRQVVGGVAP